jgi:uncharacterized protein
MSAAEVGVTTASLDGAGLAGDWWGIYQIGDIITPIRLDLQAQKQGMTGTVDIIAMDSGGDLTSLHMTKEGFTAELELPGRKNLFFEARVAGSKLTGTVKQGSSTGTLQLIRTVPVNVKALRSLEGAYQAGPRIFVMEHLFGEISSFLEYPSGEFRNIFFVGNNEFVNGPTLLAAQPEERRLKFVSGGPHTRAKVIITEGGKSFTAVRIPMRREEVVFHNGNVKLAGTLIVPLTPGRHAALVFTHGSGAAVRGSNYGLGYLLVSKGMAVLKFDKRGSGDSTGNHMTATFTELADDAIAGARLLQKRGDIDPQRIGFWGLSQGASIAPLAASRMPGTGFVIAASGGGLSLDQWELIEGANQLRTDPDHRFSEADIAEALAFERARDRYMKTHEGWEEYAAARKAAVGKAWYGYTTTDFFGPRSPDDPDWHDKAGYYFYDGTLALRTVRCPLLGIFGENDAPSSDDGNVGAFRDALSAAGNQDVTLRVLRGADHTLLETPNGNRAYLPVAKRFAPEFLPLVIDWVEKHGLTHPIP